MVKNLKLDLINVCNCKCGFCPYHGHKTTSQKHKTKSLTPDIIKNQIFTPEHTIESVQLSGSGESMIHPQFKEIVTIIRDNVGTLKIITNGTFLENEPLFISKNFDKVTVSIHGNEKTHEKIIQLKQSYKKIINGILKLKNIYNEVHLSYVLTQKNIADVNAIIEFSKKHDIPLNFALDFIPTTTEYKDSINPMINAIQNIRKSGNKVSPNLNEKELAKYFTEKSYVIDPHNCNKVKDSIEVSANGDIYMCRSEVFGKINKITLNQAIHEDKRQNFLQTIENETQQKKGLKHPRCNRCCYQQPPQNKRSELTQAKNTGIA